MAVLFFFIFFILVLLMLGISDYVLYVQYERHRNEWEADGRPYGSFYTPDVLGRWFLTKYASWGSTQKRHLRLLFRTPKWASKELTVIWALRAMRGFWLLAMCIWIVFVFFS